ncbi:MAG: cysA [Rhodospirillales bacterium]|jgi:ABC-type Fe3+/spermidine/putrescine transport system ATPase subunit|nr:cysA [Rhodospirillales bacterium]
MSPALELVHLSKRFGGVVAVDDVSFSVAQGEFLTLLGPSGSGKTTTQRLIGGFEQPDSGEIRIKGQRVDRLPPYRRDTATVFQSGALFPHKTVAENIAFGLRMRGVPAGEIGPRLKRALEVVRLGGFEDRYPAQLSGGQKQRVALARALVVEPAIVLFDEPLSALDLSLRLQLRGEIKGLHEELGFTAIYVTHDQSEAMAMSDRVAVMNAGRIEQIDRPENIFNRPANEFVYVFIGESCCLPLTVNGALRAPDGRPIDLSLARPLPEGAHRLYVRPKQLRIGSEAEVCENRILGRITFFEYLGDVYRYHVDVGGVGLFVDHAGMAPFGPGDQVLLGWSSRDMTVFQ